MRAELLPDALAEGDGPTIVIAQAGEVNTGSFDDFDAIADACEAVGAWLHVDGAFGLWAGASDRLRHLVAGVERADSWATDGHKWLNVPYDCGIALCADPAAHRRAMSATAAYLIQVDDAEGREPMAYTPEFSRRARAVPVYAAIRALGRERRRATSSSGCCEHARAFAERIARLPGCEVLNDVVLNQVLFRFADDATTTAALAAVQAGGEAWMSGTTWDGRARDPAVGLGLADDGGGHRAHGRAFAPALRASAGVRLKSDTEAGQSSAGASAACAAISETTVGSASVVVSPSGRFSATSRRRRRMILPDRVFGSSGVKTMFAGFAIAPIFCATWLRSSSSISTEPSSPPFSVT